MKKALVILTNGVEEVEAISVIDLLRRAGIDVTTSSISGEQVTGSHNITIQADTEIDDIKGLDFDMVILPGGPGTKNLRESDKVIKLVQKQHARGKYIAAICAAPTVLNMAGILSGKSITSYPSEEKTFTDSSYFYKKVVVDGNIITSRAAGTALDFAIKLIEILSGKKKADEVAEKILHTTNV
jgi:protein deglycase